MKTMVSVVFDHHTFIMPAAIIVFPLPVGAQMMVFLPSIPGRAKFSW
jgi:hypothetical protein